MFDGLFCLVVLMVSFLEQSIYSVLLLYSAMDIVLVSVINKELN